MFRAERNPELFYKGEVHSRLVLTLGSVCQKLKRQDQVERAQRIINRLHDQLGVHGKQSSFAYHSMLSINLRLLKNIYPYSFPERFSKIVCFR